MRATERAAEMFHDFPTVYAVSLWPKELVFHRFGHAEPLESTTESGPRRWVDVTACGIRADSLTGLRADHAAQIGRPCGRCFP